LCIFNEFVNHGGRRGDKEQALAQWQHQVAFSLALDMLHRAMHPTSFCRIRMAIEIASNLPAFFLVVDLLLPTTIELNNIVIIHLYLKRDTALFISILAVYSYVCGTRRR